VKAKTKAKTLTAVDRAGNALLPPPTCFKQRDRQATQALTKKGLLSLFPRFQRFPRLKRIQRLACFL
jgi:hypothetical protein